MRFPNPLVVIALDVEGGETFTRARVPVLYTGAGKINATYRLSVKLTELRLAHATLPLVLNFGTAGSRCFETGQLVSCSAFGQRDMDASALGFDVGTTPYDESPPILKFPTLDVGLPEAVCGTGDSFATSPVTTAQFNVVDMEAYALAKVCWLQGARFSSFKYITDGADNEASDSWKRNASLAAERFMEIYRKLTA